MFIITVQTDLLGYKAVFRYDSFFLNLDLISLVIWEQSAVLCTGSDVNSMSED